MSRPPAGPTPPNSLPDGEVWTATFQVTARTTERLDRFLADQSRLSRTVAGRLIGEGNVLVNGVPGRAGRSLTRGDVVDVTFTRRSPAHRLTAHPIPLTVVYEDDHLLVIDKPAGLVVHPAPGHWSDTLVNALVARGGALSGGAAGRPGIVHRLDRDTSGLMVVARTDEAHRKLATALSHRRVERTYAALVWGHLDAPVDVTAPIARHPRDRKRMAVVATGRAAETHVESVARFAVCDLVRVQLRTGRTHQIRVHLAHIGHPVVGDPVYGAGGARRVTGSQRPMADALERATPRQALHAATLSFAHPATGSWVTFQADWPDDLGEALQVASGDVAVLARPQRLGYLGFRK